MNNNELKPCPFCGGKAYVAYNGNEHIGFKQSEIGCSVCGFKRVQKYIKFKFDFEFIERTTVEAWNRRTG